MDHSLKKIIITNAEWYAKSLRGTLIPGHNGPYFDNETTVRVYSHASIILLKAYTITKKELFKTSSVKALERLFHPGARPHKWTFHHRTTKSKDFCNGLIGQAWSIEALLEGFTVLKDKKYLLLAEKVFLMHNFSNFFSYWKKREITGKKLFFDMTLNHQLWFAAIGAGLSSHNIVIKNQVEHFMNSLHKKVVLHKNGCIKHTIWNWLVRPISLIKSRKSSKYLVEKEAGYHAFNLYALSQLYRYYPSHSFWKSNTMKKVLSYAVSEEHLSIAEKNKYGFQYNPVGIETAFALQTFKSVINTSQNVSSLLERQFIQHLESTTYRMTKNTDDPETLSARLYEATRIS